MVEPLSMLADAKLHWRRTGLAARRARVTAKQTYAVNELTENILESLDRAVGLGSLARVALYRPLSTEPDVLPAAHRLQDLGSEVLFPNPNFDPRIHGYPHPTSSSHSPLLVGFGGNHDWSWSPLDAIVIPSLAVDTSGARLGRGGGWYDRLLESVTTYQETRGLSAPTLVGVCFDSEVHIGAALPTEGHDARIHLIVSEQRIIGVQP